MEIALGDKKELVGEEAYAIAEVGYDDEKIIIKDLLVSKKIETLYSPASLTKILSAIVILDYISDIDEPIAILESDLMKGSGSKFHPGDIITFRDALYLGLLESSNTAMKVASRVVGSRLQIQKEQHSLEFNSKLTRVIEEGAFSGVSNMRDITIPDCVIEIQSKAFSNCKRLREVIIPKSVTHIADNVFDGCSDLKIIGERGSYAHNYANENEIGFLTNKQFKLVQYKRKIKRKLKSLINTALAEK